MLILYPNQFLNQIANINVDSVTPELSRVAEEMVDIMTVNKGIGLAANQIGRLERIVVMVDNKNILRLFNPVILMKSAVKQNKSESCLSFPNKRIKIKRSVEVKVRYLDQFNKMHVDTFKDLSAQVIQHEIDHLNGITLQDHEVDDGESNR